MAAVAFLGLGTMGAPMAGRLVAAGHEVTGWNRTRTSVAGARIADTPAAAAGDADIVITMLANPAAVEDVVFGTDGAVSAIQASRSPMRRWTPSAPRCPAMPTTTSAR